MICMCFVVFPKKSTQCQIPCVDGWMSARHPHPSRSKAGMSEPNPCVSLDRTYLNKITSSKHILITVESANYAGADGWKDVATCLQHVLWRG